MSGETLVITGCGTLASDTAMPVTGLFDEPFPVPKAFALPDFDPVATLGRKTARFVDRSTALVLVSCGLALVDAGLVIDDDCRNEIGIAVGTSTGSVSGAYQFGRETYRSDRPYLVNAALFPNSVLNRAAAQAAIHLGARGVNSTLAGGRVSGLMALWHAELALRAGYVSTMVVGAVEEFTPANAWVGATGWGGGSGSALGEAASFVVLERRDAALAAGRTERAEVLAVELHGTDDLASGDRCAAIVDDALRTAGVAAADVRIVSAAGMTEQIDAAWQPVLRDRLGGVTRWERPEQRYGDCFSAMSAVQLADVLDLHSEHPELRGPVALILSVDQENGIGAAVLRGIA